MRHALLENGKVVNIIEIDPRNASDFKNAVTIPDGVGAGIGDTYEDGRFYRYNEETEQKEEILPYDPMAGVYEQMQVTANTAMRPMMLAMGDVMQIQSANLMGDLPESAGYLASVYPVWQPDTAYKQWQLITHKGIAYQVQQDTTSQEIYPPDGTGLLAIYVPYVVPGADGVKPWAYGAHYYTGDLVRKDGVVWEAKKDMIPCVWEPTEGNEWTKRDDLA